MSDGAKKGATKGRTGDFFTIDIRTWHRVCALEMNAEVAYLVLARFSLGYLATVRTNDSRKTSASTNAVEKYTGIPRDKGRAAIEALIRGGAVVRTQGGTKPRYELPAFHELQSRSPLTPEEQRFFDHVASGNLRPWEKQKRSNDIFDALSSAESKGWLKRANNGDFSVAPGPDPTPDMVWLPNALVDGSGPSILERVRKTQDPLALRLLIDLYSTHNLLSEGGVRRDVTYRPYERTKLGEKGVYVVWGFKPKPASVWMHSPVVAVHKREKFATGENAAVDWFKRMGLLEDCGAIEWMPHVYESESPEASAIHPYGIDRKTSARDCIECAIGLAAHRAGTKLLLDSQREKGKDMLLVPVESHIANVAMVGIARLRLQPRTSRTDQWRSELYESGKAAIAKYDAIAAGETGIVVAVKPAPAPAVSPEQARANRETLDRLSAGLMEKWK